MDLQNYSIEKIQQYKCESVNKLELELNEESAKIYYDWDSFLSVNKVSLYNGSLFIIFQ